MAKFGTYYGLCPLVDQRSFVGLADDVNETNCVLVTLDKKFAVKYKLTDQRQLHSWSSREHFTSKVIYDAFLQQYAAVFNNNVIRVFGNDCVHLDRIKKYKFAKKIHAILPRENNLQSAIVFKNGTISLLSHALNNIANLDTAAILKDDEKLDDVKVLNRENGWLAVYFVKNHASDVIFYAVPINEEKCAEDAAGIVRIPLTRVQTHVKLAGYTVCVSYNGMDIDLFTLWSDGKLYSYTSTTNQPFPGTYLSSLQLISCKQLVSITAIDSNHLAMYGTAANDDGACMLIYNVRYHLEQCRETFKIFSEGSKIFVHNNTHLIFTVTNSIAVLPFHLRTEKLSDLLGSNQLTCVIDDDISVVNEVEIADWRGDSMIVDLDVELPDYFPTKHKRRIEQLLKEGYSEHQICDELLPELLKSNHTQCLQWIFNNFVHINEHWCVKIIQYKLNKSKFTHPDDLLNTTLKIQYNTVSMTKHLRKLTVNEAILFLKYLIVHMQHDADDLACVLDWITVLIDAQFQAFSLAHDDNVRDLMEKLSHVVRLSLDCLHEEKHVACQLERIVKRVGSDGGFSSAWYCVDDVDLYG